LKLDTRQVGGFLRDPGTCRLVLLHGEDEGLIRERAQALTQRVAGSLNDPFLVAELDREGWPRIGAEMASLSMIGGRRVVRVRECAEAVLSHVVAAMKGPGAALLILEAPGLGKGKLRSFVEAASDAVSIGCYPEEGRALSELIASIFAELRVTADPDAVGWLTEALGGDRAVVRGEVEKLALLCGSGGTVDIDMARACTGEAAARAGDDGLMAAMCGDLEAADRAIEAAIADGMNGVGLIRVSLMQLQKMHLAGLRMEQGASAAEAVRAMRPPVFGRATSAMISALSLWPAEALLRAIEEARRVELSCKQTGSRPDLLARRYIASLARAAHARRSRRA
jgi:DNA polymerase-3 subunit delta